jgi:hypothetical protein
MERDTTDTIQALSNKRAAALKAAERWRARGYIGVEVGVIADITRSWREAGGEWKRFFTFEGPARLLKRPLVAATYALALASFAIGYLKAKEAGAFQEAIAEVAKRGPEHIVRPGDVVGPTEQEINMIAKDAMEDTGSAEALKQYAATKDPEERKNIKAGWEEKMAQRKAASLAPDVATARSV